MSNTVYIALYRQIYNNKKTNLVQYQYNYAAPYPMQYSAHGIPKILGLVLKVVIFVKKILQIFRKY